MSKWSVATLSEVATIAAGSTPKTAVDEYWNGEYNWVTPAELNDTSIVINETERKITEKAIKDTSLKALPIGTVLLSSRAPIGKVAIAGVEMYCNQGFKNLICSNKIYNMYLFWFLKGKTEFLNSLGRGATFKEISKTIVGKIQIPLPPLETQKQIAKTLDTAAELLVMRKQQLAELDDLIKSTFYDMFGDPVTNEKGWEVEKLGCVLKESPQNGLYKPSSAYTNDNLGTPILRIDSFYDGELKQPLTLKRLNCTQKEIDLYSLSQNDVVINRVNSIEYLGKCAHITDLLEKTVFESNMMRLKTRDTVINSKYLTIFLCTPYIYNQILSHAKKAVNQASINQKDVQDFNILVPPLSFQIKYASVVTKIDEQKALVKKAIDETQHLFDSLMSEYFE